MNSPLRVATFSRVSGGAGVLPVLVHVLVHVLYLADSDVAYEFGEDERITGAGNAFLGHLFSSRDENRVRPLQVMAGEV